MVIEGAQNLVDGAPVTEHAPSSGRKVLILISNRRFVFTRCIERLA